MELSDNAIGGGESSPSQSTTNGDVMIDPFIFSAMGLIIVVIILAIYFSTNMWIEQSLKPFPQHRLRITIFGLTLTVCTWNI